MQNETQKDYLTPSFTYAEADAVKTLWEDSCTFNSVAGGDLEITPFDFLNQFNLIEEEFKELKEGLTLNDPIEQLDGAIDVLVTVFGYLQKLRNRYGINISEAMDLIGKNNLSKFPTSEEVAKQTVQMYADKGIPTYYTYSKTYDVFIIRDQNTHKIKKPINFKAVELSGAFPTYQ